MALLYRNGGVPNVCHSLAKCMQRYCSDIECVSTSTSNGTVLLYNTWCGHKCGVVQGIALYGNWRVPNVCHRWPNVCSVTAVTLNV